MLEDVLLIEEKHHRAGELIVEYILAHKKEKMIIAISGESGSGKSELSHVIAKSLTRKGVLSKTLHTDNYYNTHPWIRTSYREKNGIENVVGLQEYDWEKIYENLADFRAGRVSTMPCVDLVTEQVDELKTDFEPVKMLVMDGLYAIHAEHIDLRIFIELSFYDTKRAQLLRGKEPQNEYRMKVLEQEHKVVQSLKEKANILINENYEVRFK